LTAPSSSRLAYIDWMRGLACVLMFQTHCYDSWLGTEARKGAFFRWSQLVGTLPAPLFLFLAGISFALVTDKLRQRGADPNQIARTTILRGAEIFGLGMLFRVQEYLLGLPWSPWTDLLRVDILNTIGFSMMLMGIMCWLVRGGRARLAAVAAAVALAVALVTPLLWTTWRWVGLPWPFESYVNGVHIFKQPQAWLFPIFPWAGFAFAGLAVGFVLVNDWARKRGAAAFALLGGTGIAIIATARGFDHYPRQLYAVYDFWHTSPNFFLIRVGLLLAILFGVYAWCRWDAANWGFSPMIQIGRTSLLVYWVHIEFVYGRFSILPKRSMSIGQASLGLAVIFVAMLLLSLARTRLKGRGAEVLGFVFRRGLPQKRAAIAP
jgi:uncharacterized membrane protein